MANNDERTFSVDVANDLPRMWAILEALEAVAASSASERSEQGRCRVHVAHASGRFSRDSVAEARSTSTRNNFVPESLRVEFALKIPYDESDWDWCDWVQVRGYSPLKRLDVTVEYGSEVEVNGVYTALKEAAEAVPMPPPPPEPVYVPVAPPPPEPEPMWKRVFEHSWVAGIGAGLVVLGIPTLWALFWR